MILRLAKLVVLIYLGLSLVGCATPPRSGAKGAEAETVGAATPIRDPNKPSLFLAGGDMQQVRGVAMAAAFTQGWQIKNASGNSLFLHRNLDNATMETLAPGASRGPLPPLIEVRTDFFPRAGGVDVQLGAQVISRRGSDKEAHQDYTETYRNELMHSLASLQTSWQETGPRVANALPPIGGLRDAQPNASAMADTGLARESSGFEAVDAGSIPASSTVSFEAESGDRATPVTQSAAATWALPAAGAATATATATARANALHPASSKAPVSPALPSATPAPVVSRSASPLAAGPSSQASAFSPAKASPLGAPATTPTRVATNTIKPLPAATKTLALPASSQAAAASQTAPVKGKTDTTQTAKTASASASTRDIKTLTASAGKPAGSPIAKPEAPKNAKPTQPASPPAPIFLANTKAAVPTKAAGSPIQPSAPKSANNPKATSKAEAASSQTAASAKVATSTTTGTKTASSAGKTASTSAAKNTSTKYSQAQGKDR